MSSIESLLEAAMWVRDETKEKRDRPIKQKIKNQAYGGPSQ